MRIIGSGHTLSLEAAKPLRGIATGLIRIVGGIAQVILNAIGLLFSALTSCCRTTFPNLSAKLLLKDIAGGFWHIGLGVFELLPMTSFYLKRIEEATEKRDAEERAKKTEQGEDLAKGELQRKTMELLYSSIIPFEDCLVNFLMEVKNGNNVILKGIPSENLVGNLYEGLKDSIARNSLIKTAHFNDATYLYQTEKAPYAIHFCHPEAIDGHINNMIDKISRNEAFSIDLADGIPPSMLMNAVDLVRHLKKNEAARLQQELEPKFQRLETNLRGLVSEDGNRLSFTPKNKSKDAPAGPKPKQKSRDKRNAVKTKTKTKNTASQLPTSDARGN